MYSSADLSVSFDSTWSNTLDADSFKVGLISAYSGDDYSSNTWDGDSNVDAWLGLALDHSGSNESYNILYDLQQQGTFDDLLFSMKVDLGGSSTLALGQSSASPQWYPSKRTNIFAADIVGFMVSNSPTTDVLTNSFILEAKTALIDTSSMATFIPTTYFATVMDELLKTSIGFFFDTDLETYVISCD